MISENLDGEGGTMEVVSPDFEGMDDCQEFSIIDIVIPFHWRERLREVRTRVPFAV